jgi:hypothetical protein
MPGVARSRVSAAALLALLTSSWAPAQAPSVDNSPLVGTWIMTDPATHCTEVYDFRRDGSVYIVSGDERSESTYALSARPGPSGRHRLTVTMQKYYGGKDCAGTTDDTTGKPNTSYLLFFPGKRLMAVCQDETSDEKCFGPLQKLNR